MSFYIFYANSDSFSDDLNFLNNLDLAKLTALVSNCCDIFADNNNVFAARITVLTLFSFKARRNIHIGHDMMYLFDNIVRAIPYWVSDGHYVNVYANKIEWNEFECREILNRIIAFTEIYLVNLDVEKEFMQTVANTISCFYNKDFRTSSDFNFVEIEEHNLQQFATSEPVAGKSFDIN